MNSLYKVLLFSSLSFALISAAPSGIANCLTGTTTGVTITSSNTASVASTYSYNWAIKIAKVTSSSSPTYCYYDHLYGFQVTTTVTGSTDTASSNAKVYY